MSCSGPYLTFPPSCTESYYFSPGCFPCPSSVTKNPITASAKTYTNFNSITTTTPITLNKINYSYAVLQPNPLNGIQGVQYFFTTCASKLKASLFLIPQGQDVASTLSSYYINGTTPDVIRINLGDPFVPFLGIKGGQFKSIAWDSETSLAQYMSSHAATGWAYSENNVVSTPAVVEANITPFHTTFWAIYFSANQASTQARKPGEAFSYAYRRNRFATSSSLSIGANIIAQGIPFSGSVAMSGNYTIFQTQLGVPQESVPQQTSLTPQSIMVPVLLWTTDCNLLPQTICSSDMSGTVCNYIPCADEKATIPISVCVTKPDMAGAIPPSSSTSATPWNVSSYRTSALWILEQVDSGSNLSDLGSGQNTKTEPCDGINIIMTTRVNDYYTGAVTFCACPPYTGSTAGMDTNSTLRVILGGQPSSGPTGIYGINAPQLLAITANETKMSTETGIGSDEPNAVDWTKMPTWFVPPTTTTVQMPAFATIDVTIIEEQVSTGVRVWAVIKAIEQTTPDNPYWKNALPSFTNSCAAVTDIPFITPTNIKASSYPSSLMPVAILSLSESPLSPNTARGILVNVPDTTPIYYLVARTDQGLPGAEGITTVYTAPPTLLASTDFVKGPKASYVFVNFAMPMRTVSYSSIVLYSAPIPIIPTQVNAAGSSPLIPCIRLLVNGSTQQSNTFTCALTDGNDSWLAQGNTVNQSTYTTANAVLINTCCALFELNPTSVVAYVWLYALAPGAPNTLPGTGPSCIVELPLNPLTVCSTQQTLYLYAHSPYGPSGITIPDPPAQGAAPFVVYPDTSQLGNITNFPCPSNISDVTLQQNICRSNIESQSNYMVDATLDPLQVVGVYAPIQVSQVKSVFTGETEEVTRRKDGIVHQVVSQAAKQARDMSFTPDKYMEAITQKGDAAFVASQYGNCPNYAPLCAPALSTSSIFNYNYNSIATTCPLPTSFDPNLESCFAQGVPCTNNNCAETPSIMQTPQGACTNPNSCDIWFSASPGMSRSCLNATYRGALTDGQGDGYLGPLMPGFSPDPSACAQPGSVGCPSLDVVGGTLCNPPTSSPGGPALFTSVCAYPPNETGCDQNGICDAASIPYESTDPCKDGTNLKPTFCTSAVEAPTQATVTNFGVFPFGQMPCYSGLKATATSALPGQNPHSNYITCPTTTADEASWFQTVFGCQPVTPPANFNAVTNYFGEQVISTPIKSDITGGSGGYGGLGPGWTSSTAKNGQTLLTYTGKVQAGQVYPQACLNPTTALTMTSFDPTQSPPPQMDVQLSYCIDGDSTGSCYNTIAQFVIENGQYVPVAPAALAANKGDVVICGMVDPSKWYETYTTGVPLVSDMVTNGVGTSQPQYALANAFTSYASMQYQTTGRNSSQGAAATSVYATSTSSALPANTNLNMIASNDANIVSVLSSMTAKTPLQIPMTDGGVAFAYALGITPWYPSGY